MDPGYKNWIQIYSCLMKNVSRLSICVFFIKKTPVMKVFLRKIKKTAKIVNAVGGQMHHFFRAGPHF